MNQTKWFLQSGPDHDIAISTRIRLARNITDYPFPSRMNDLQRQELNERIGKVLSTADTAPLSFTYFDMEQTDDAVRWSMVERHLVSPQFARYPEGRYLYLSEDERVSIMVGEEDHLRIQVLTAGLDPTEGLALAQKMDGIFDRAFRYAFDQQLGYLTECPTNLGTGLRASVMLHLPALRRNGSIARISSTVSKLGLTVRGAYGEGTDPAGDFYQLSNQITLGISEEEAVSNLSGLAGQIILQERKARQAEAENRLVVEDRTYRALGLLKSARLMSGDEFLKLSSALRMGLSLQIIDCDTLLTALNSLIFDVGAATLQRGAGRLLPEQERDTLRAQVIRERLESICRD